MAKIIVAGHARHGKDLFCEYMNIKHVSSSLVALDKVIWPSVCSTSVNTAWANKYDNKDQCFNDRGNHRNKWYDLIINYNKPDKTRLMKEIFAISDVYCGLRNREEFMLGRDNGLFDLSVWIDASEFVAPERPDSCTLLKHDCDIIITNNGTKKDLQRKALNLAKSLRLKPGPESQDTLHDLIVDWADQVHPDRTITNAIHKLVLEEIPEYLLAQGDPMELADLGILIYDIAHLAKIDLDKAIRDKMDINIHRTWEVDKITGLLQHHRGGMPILSETEGQGIMFVD